jgi:hypothetical protein
LGSHAAPACARCSRRRLPLRSAGGARRPDGAGLRQAAAPICRAGAPRARCCATGGRTGPGPWAPPPGACAPSGLQACAPTAPQTPPHTPHTPRRPAPPAGCPEPQEPWQQRGLRHRAAHQVHLLGGAGHRLAVQPARLLLRAPLRHPRRPGARQVGGGTAPPWASHRASRPGACLPCLRCAALRCPALPACVPGLASSAQRRRRCGSRRSRGWLAPAPAPAGTSRSCRSCCAGCSGRCRGPALGSPSSPPLLAAAAAPPLAAPTFRPAAGWAARLQMLAQVGA